MFLGRMNDSASAIGAGRELEITQGILNAGSGIEAVAAGQLLDERRRFTGGADAGAWLPTHPVRLLVLVTAGVASVLVGEHEPSKSDVHHVRVAAESKAQPIGPLFVARVSNGTYWLSFGDAVW